MEEQAQHEEEYMYMQLYYIYLTTLHSTQIWNVLFCPMKIFTSKDKLHAAIFTWNYVTQRELLNRKFF